MSLGIVEKNGKFIVTKNDKPVLLPNNSNQTMVVEFSSMQDAEKYMNILLNLQKQKKYKN
jgi:hypothetical protein